MSDTAVRTPEAKSYGGSDTSAPPIWKAFLRWESALVVVLVAVVLFGSSESSHFLNTTTIFFVGLNVGEVAIMALPLLLIVMIGEIDLSVAAMLGLSGAVMGHLYQHGTSIWLAMAASLLVGVVGGTLNGFLVARLGLPSIAVTIGTLTLFRGIAEIVLPNPTDKLFPAGSEQGRHRPAARHADLLLRGDLHRPGHRVRGRAARDAVRALTLRDRPAARSG